MDAEWAQMSIVQLRTELVKIGAKTLGRKAELTISLGDYFRNSNFQGPPISLPEEQPMPNWPHFGFRSVTLDTWNCLPKVLHEHVEQYVVTRQVMDKRSSCDHGALKRGKKMDDSVEALSFLKTPELVFFTGIVSAEMKKHVSYNIKITVDQSSGEVQNSACECPAGKGPSATCKHIVCVLLLLVKFTSGVRKFVEDPGKIVRDAGLVIDPAVPFLAASPDGFVENEESLLEVKCPFKIREEMPSINNLDFLHLDSNGKSFS
ncbi:hypothetical protein TCAL_16683 [Tigriopus californicus]|uniref:SWIM-type domain-containing protein n=1 Tax=Tigriopus californicus TaxID=6832 RepID=A0A553PKG2_TIGCA|nr:hypothetical protein TCAL_16683 [Tigriopus californicus]